MFQMARRYINVVKIVVVILCLEALHTLYRILVIVCRLADAVLPRFLSATIRFIFGASLHFVRVENGLVQGETQPPLPGHSVHRIYRCVKFEGVPYAALNGDRFGPPVPLASLPDAAVRAPIVNRPRFFSWGFAFGTSATAAPQTCRIFTLDSPVAFAAAHLASSAFQRGFHGNEAECLQLNIWCPQNSWKAHKNLPVMVFFHGGGFVFGSCHQSLANGVALAEKGCIVVSCNYRLGILGYMRVPGKCSNRGLRDQVEALRWVKANIARFGGDVNNITVSGQSAGSMSAGALLGLPCVYTERLFAKAIMVSGTAHHLPNQSSAEHLFSYSAKIAKISEEHFGKCLEVMPMSDLIALQKKIEFESAIAYREHKTHNFIPFIPFVTKEDPDGFFNAHPLHFIQDRIQSGQAIIPILAGTTDAEYTFFTRMAVKRDHHIKDPSVNLRVRQWVSTVFKIPMNASPAEEGTNASSNFLAFIAQVEAAYNGGEKTRRIGPPHAAFNAINGDWVFRLPTEFLATTYASSKSKKSRGVAWVYRFDRHAIIPGLGATHAVDLHYIFNSWWCAPYYTGVWSKAVQDTSDNMSCDFVRFMKADVEQMLQNPTDAMGWEYWDGATRPARVYGTGKDKSGASVVLGSDAAETAAWGTMLADVLQATHSR